MRRVEGKVAFITGVARGQGRAHALKLASEGADIIGVDLLEDVATNEYPMARQEDLDETAQLVEKEGRRAVLSKADVRNPQQLRAAVDAGVKELGRLDIVVANAGICPLGGHLSGQAFVDVIDVNLAGVTNTVSATYPHLEAGGSIVATGSLAAFIPRATDNPAAGPGGLGYSLAKRTVAAIVHDLAFALGPEQIRVNGVHPTNCNTDMLNSQPMYDQFRPDVEHPTREQALEAMPAMTRLGNPYIEPEDISNAVLFLSSDEARYITGMQLRVDAGGYLNFLPFTP